ncbi:MAG: porin [Burkholderiales bacterium]|nr:porin [Burkholderiales bacterium]
MKKSLIALAVLAASGAAMAQSSVTMYGVADLSLAKASGVSAQMSGNGLMNNGNSRLGVRGVEDLGGGLKASFNFEQSINAKSGATDAATYQRNAWLALSGGFGRFQMGRTLNPSFYGVAAWELTGTANYSVVGNQFGFTGEGPRTNSVFQYTTPNMGGFSGTIGYTAKPDNSGNAKTDLNLIYANGPIAVALSYNKTNTLQSNVALGGSYDFGMFKLAGSLQDDKAINAKGFTLGGTVPVGPVALTLDIARQTNSGFKNTDVLLEAKYALSKRTFTYATYYKDGADDAGNYKTGAKNTFGLGVRHNF